ncbi:MAG: M48 family metallopeptidase [Bacilli bacterium]|jgi:predicted metal-dependent hydrolase|nr:M48 family metallopeptidase [Bacilli bacterium]
MIYLEYGGYTFNIIKKASNKNIYFRKQLDGSIKVTCPFHLNKKELYKYFDNYLARIKQGSHQCKVGYTDGSIFIYLGKEYIIQYVKSANQEYCFLKDNYLIVYLHNEHDLAHNKQVIDLFIMKQAVKIITEIFDDILEKFTLIDFRPQLKIRNMTSKFGVCYYKKNSITLAAMLIHYDIECISYVIIHELGHFIQPNHSKKFYYIIESYLPNYKEIVKKLKY